MLIYMKLIVTFIIFAGIVYYFNLDITILVEKSGAPQWFEKKGYVTKSPAFATSTVLQTP